MNIEQILNTRKVVTSFWLKNKLFEHNIKEKRCENCRIDNWLGKNLAFELHHIDGNHINNLLSNLQILCPNCHSQSINFRGRGKLASAKRSIVPVERILEIIPLCYTRREVLLKVGLVGKGANYMRINRILKEHPNIQLKESQHNKQERKKIETLRKIKEHQESDSTIAHNTKNLYHEGSLGCGPTKVKWMDDDQLKKLVWEISSIKLAKELGVTSNAVKHRCKQRNIPTPPPGYWRKLETGRIKECQIIKEQSFAKHKS